MNQINCRQAQQWASDLARNRLDEPMAGRVRRHLEDCTDCRVRLERSIRLQRLLVLKRYETPPAPYMEGFLTEFHQRLAWADRQRSWFQLQIEQTGWAWDKYITAHWQPITAIASVAAVVAIAGWWTVQYILPLTRISEPDQAQPLPVAIIVKQTPAPLPPVPEPAPIPSLHVAPAPNRVALSHTRYVMDRFTTTPASYETAQFDF